MREMTESQRRWQAWFDAFVEMRRSWPASDDVPCPDGDRGRLHLTYYSAAPGKRNGAATLWCEVGRNGIFLHRVGIPEGADTLRFDATDEQRAAVLPEITLIPDDPYLPDEE